MRKEENEIFIKKLKKKRNLKKIRKKIEIEIEERKEDKDEFEIDVDFIEIIERIDEERKGRLKKKKLNIKNLKNGREEIVLRKSYESFRIEEFEKFEILFEDLWKGRKIEKIIDMRKIEKIERIKDGIEDWREMRIKKEERGFKEKIGDILS